MKPIKALTDLTPDPENANQGTARGLSAVETSLQEYGGGRSIVVDRDGVIIAGNKTHERAVDLGFKARVIETTGDELVVVVRKDLSLKDDPTKARGLAYADNRAGQLGLDWNPKQIAADLEEGFAFAPVFFTEAEIDTILNRDVQRKQGHTDPDDVPDAPEQHGIEKGDLFALGDHLLLCGDATVQTDVDRVMQRDVAAMVFTDPPYGVSYDGGVQKKHKKLKDDHAGTDIYSRAIPLMWASSEAKAPWYVFYAGSHELEIFPAFAAAKLEIRSALIWKKNHAQFGALSAQYKLIHEHFVYMHRAGESPHWYGPANEISVWEADRATKNEYHPTQKPVALAERALTNSSKPGDIVIDFFGGSGSTLIACETMRRKCRMIELEGKHVRTIIDRWEAFTQQKAVKL